MDDGYFYKRDKIAYLYIPKYSHEETERLLKVLKNNFSLEAKMKIKKGGNKVLVFSVNHTQKLISFIEPHIIPSMRYKITSF
jgi:transposase